MWDDQVRVSWNVWLWNTRQVLICSNISTKKRWGKSKQRYYVEMTLWIRNSIYPAVIVCFGFCQGAYTHWKSRHSRCLYITQYKSRVTSGLLQDRSVIITVGSGIFQKIKNYKDHQLHATSITWSTVYHSWDGDANKRYMPQNLTLNDYANSTV